MLVTFLDFLIGVLLLRPWAVFWEVFGVVVAVVSAPFIMVMHGFDFHTLQGVFKFTKQVPMGVHLQRFLVRVCSPYAASIPFEIVSLDGPSCTVQLEDWPWLRNPFNSVHAAALCNLAELTCGLAMTNVLQSLPQLRGIPVRVDCQYRRKGRGLLTSKCTVSTLYKAGTYLCFVSVTDSLSRVICEATVHWVVSENQ